ncbi:MAG: hypothetical protein OIN85_00900 [Candidatus Methanoperedens sp.]|nr:hypothetical protein [Candidatus Methanoperedens sp.]
MSRTKKGKKGAGWEYWGKRPLRGGGRGTKGKRDGIQVERAKLKRQTKREARDAS